nr:hypothetical protein [uncultured Actinoplanes sp.]
MDLVTQSPPAPTEKSADGAHHAGTAEIHPEDEQAAPRAFAGLIAAAQLVLQTVEITGIYTPHDAVNTVEQTTAVLHRLITGFGPYVGDFSADGAKTMARASDLLGQARTQLSDARNHLMLDNPPRVTLVEAIGTAAT